MEWRAHQGEFRSPPHGGEAALRRCPQKGAPRGRPYPAAAAAAAYRLHRPTLRPVQKGTLVRWRVCCLRTFQRS